MFFSVDVDECDVNAPLHDCHPNATCENTIGSFTCVCNPSFTGSGKMCQRRSFQMSAASHCSFNYTVYASAMQCIWNSIADALFEDFHALTENVALGSDFEQFIGCTSILNVSGSFADNTEWFNCFCRRKRMAFCFFVA